MWKLLVKSFLFCLLLASLTLAQWSEPVEILGSFGFASGDGIAVGENLHIVLSSSLFTYIRSTDNGATWSQAVYPIIDPSYNCYIPNIISSPGKLHIFCVGRKIPDDQDQQLYYINSDDNGYSWSDPRKIFQNYSPLLNFPKAASSGDTLFVCCKTDTELVVFVSFNSGATWSRRTNIEEGPIVIDQDPYLFFKNNHLIAVYSIARTNSSLSYEVYCRVSYNRAISWTEAIPISTLEYAPYCIPSQLPSAYVDSTGLIVTCWMDYKYGSMCNNITGDILGRVSSDYGITWGEEFRVTNNQSSVQSSCIIINDNIHAIWVDYFPEGCSRPKILYACSTDNGSNWSNQVRISSIEGNIENDPNILFLATADNTMIHSIFSMNLSGEESYYYSQNNLTSAIEDTTSMIQRNSAISAYPNPFNSATTITLTGAEQAEIGIYDITGRLIATLHTSGGQALWDASGVSSGLYFARVVGEKSRTIKLMLVK